MAALVTSPEAGPDVSCGSLRLPVCAAGMSELVRQLVSYLTRCVHTLNLKCQLTVLGDDFSFELRLALAVELSAVRFVIQQNH